MREVYMLAVGGLLLLGLDVSLPGSVVRRLWRRPVVSSAVRPEVSAALLDPPPAGPEWVDTEALIRDLLLAPPVLPVLDVELLHVRAHREPLALPAVEGPRHRRLPMLVDDLTDPSNDVEAPTIWFEPARDGLHNRLVTP